MGCQSRPAGRMAAVLLVASLAFWKLAGHFLGAAVLLVAIAAATAGAAVAAAVALAAFQSARRARAAAAGSPNLQHGAPEAPAPRWPDRPIYHAGPADHVEQRERVGSAR